MRTREKVTSIGAVVAFVLYFVFGLIETIISYNQANAELAKEGLRLSGVVIVIPIAMTIGMVVSAIFVLYKIYQEEREKVHQELQSINAVFCFLLIGTSLLEIFSVTSQQVSTYEEMLAIELAKNIFIALIIVAAITMIVFLVASILAKKDFKVNVSSILGCVGSTFMIPLGILVIVASITEGMSVLSILQALCIFVSIGLSFTYNMFMFKRDGFDNALFDSIIKSVGSTPTPKEVAPTPILENPFELEGNIVKVSKKRERFKTNDLKLCFDEKLHIEINGFSLKVYDIAYKDITKFELTKSEDNQFITLRIAGNNMTTLIGVNNIPYSGVVEHQLRNDDGRMDEFADKITQMYQEKLSK